MNQFQWRVQKAKVELRSWWLQKRMTFEEYAEKYEQEINIELDQIDDAYFASLPDPPPPKQPKREEPEKPRKPKGSRFRTSGLGGNPIDAAKSALEGKRWGHRQLGIAIMAVAVISGVGLAIYFNSPPNLGAIRDRLVMTKWSEVGDQNALLTFHFDGRYNEGRIYPQGNGMVGIGPGTEGDFEIISGDTIMLKPDHIRTPYPVFYWFEGEHFIMRASGDERRYMPRPPRQF